MPAPTLDYLASLEWITARENLALLGPAGTGKSHLLVALGIAAVHAGRRVRYLTAAELVETLYRGMADISIDRVIDGLPHNDLILIDEVGFAPLDDTAAQLLFRIVVTAYERRSLDIASHWASLAIGPSSNGARSYQNTPPPSACSTDYCTTPTSSSPKASPTACAKPNRKEPPPQTNPDQIRKMGTFISPPAGLQRFWHTFRDWPAGFDYAGLRIRLRSRSNLARPNIWRLIILMRLTVPSTGPELKSRVSPAVTVSRSVASPRAKDRRAHRSSRRCASTPGDGRRGGR